MQDEPRPSEIVGAVAAFLRGAATKESGPHIAFQLRVAGNALEIAQRQLDLAPVAEAEELARLKALPARCQDAEAIQNEVYEAGKAAGFEPLRGWFQALYEVLLGQSQGPRFGSFAAIFGLENTIALLERALA